MVIGHFGFLDFQSLGVNVEQGVADAGCILAGLIVAVFLGGSMSLANNALASVHLCRASASDKSG